MGHPVQPGDPLECQGLSSKAGAIGVMRPTEAGDLRFAPLARIRTHRMRARSGLYRWYNDYRLPEHLGGGQITVGLHHDDEDRKRRFNRTENRPADPALGSGLRPSLRPAKRLRVAEPGPGGHPVPRPSPQPRLAPSAGRGTRLGPDGQRPHHGPPQGRWGTRSGRVTHASPSLPSTAQGVREHAKMPGRVSGSGCRPTRYTRSRR